MLGLAALNGVSIGSYYISSVLATQLISGTETGLVGLMEMILGPLWVFIAFGEAPSRWTFIGGSLLLATLIVHTVSSGQSGAEWTLPSTCKRMCGCWGNRIQVIRRKTSVQTRPIVKLSSGPQEELKKAQLTRASTHKISVETRPIENLSSEPQEELEKAQPTRASTQSDQSGTPAGRPSVDGSRYGTPLGRTSVISSVYGSPTAHVSVDGSQYGTPAARIAV